MSNFSIEDQLNNELFVGYDLSKVFLRDNTFKLETLENSSYNPVTYVEGTVLGRVAATGVVVPFSSTASDGSEYPIGVLHRGLTLAGGATANVMNCLSGWVASEFVAFGNATDSLESVVQGRQVQDLLRAAGIVLIQSTELTMQDNY